MPKFSWAVSNQNLSAEEMAAGAHYLACTRDGLVASTAALTAAQWDFKPAADRWSIAEVVEHLAIIEQRVHAIVEMMNGAPEPPLDWVQAEVEERIFRAVPDRSTRYSTPEAASPARRWCGPEGLQEFIASREQSIQLLSAPSLRGHVVPHPYLGPWDGYQWLMAAGAHCLRHTGQICEVKAEPDFPPPASVVFVTSPR